MFQQVQAITGRNRRRMASNVIHAYGCSTEDHRLQGADWYPRAHRLAVHLADRGQLSVPAAAGIIAALSPMVSWGRNVEAATNLVHGAPISGVLHANVAKAQRIHQGEDPAVVLGGRKVLAFWQLIAGLAEPNTVCVDRHAFDVAVGRETNDLTRKALDRVGVYDLMSSAYALAADELGVAPEVVQATTWCWWRDSKRSLSVAA